MKIPGLRVIAKKAMREFWKQAEETQDYTKYMDKLRKLTTACVTLYLKTSTSRSGERENTPS